MLRHHGEGDDQLTRTHHFRHLMVPLDGASFAEVALAPAAALAAAFHATLTLLRVVAPVNEKRYLRPVLSTRLSQDR